MKRYTLAITTLFIALGLVCLIAADLVTRSMTLPAVPAATDLVWTNDFPPIIMDSVGISFGTNTVSGQVRVETWRGTTKYNVSTFTMASQTSAIIECDKGWTLNNTDALRISTTNCGQAATAILNGRWKE